MDDDEAVITYISIYTEQFKVERRKPQQVPEELIMRSLINNQSSLQQYTPPDKTSEEEHEAVKAVSRESIVPLKDGKVDSIKEDDKIPDITPTRSNETLETKLRDEEYENHGEVAVFQLPCMYDRKRIEQCRWKTGKYTSFVRNYKDCLPASSVPGIGPAAFKILRGKGVKTAGQLLVITESMKMDGNDVLSWLMTNLKLSRTGACECVTALGEVMDVLRQTDLSTDNDTK